MSLLLYGGDAGTTTWCVAITVWQCPGWPGLGGWSSHLCWVLIISPATSTCMPGWSRR